MPQTVSDSQFYMWRTLFAVAHADDDVSDAELSFMVKALSDISFSDDQVAVLKDDILNPQNVDAMFEGITNEADRLQFFDLARDLVWADGVYDESEQSVMIRLHNKHIKGTNLDDMVGRVTLEFEADSDIAPVRAVPKKERSLLSVLNIFRNRFSGD